MTHFTLMNRWAESRYKNVYSSTLFWYNLCPPNRLWCANTFSLEHTNFARIYRERHFNPDTKNSETFHCSKMLQDQTVACKTILHLHMSENDIQALQNNAQQNQPYFSHKHGTRLQFAWHNFLPWMGELKSRYKNCVFFYSMLVGVLFMSSTDSFL
jgi:hypothetical protein